MTKENKNGQTISDGQYILTVNEYNSIQGHMNQIQDHMKQIYEILSRSCVNGNVRESVVNQNVAPGATKLNDDVVKNLIGHTNVVYYNFETRAWNTDTYNGFVIYGQAVDTTEVLSFKTAMEREPKFSAQYEMVASVTMTIDCKFYPGWKKTIRNPQYRNKETTVVGNIIVKNKTTGKYELYGKSWIGVDDYRYPGDAVYFGARRFANDGAWNFGFRAAVHRAHTL